MLITRDTGPDFFYSNGRYYMKRSHHSISEAAEVQPRPTSPLPLPSSLALASTPSEVSTRRACSALLAGALAAGSTEAEACSAGVASGIERALRERHGNSSGREYKAAARSMVLNLKRNEDLRQQLLDGRLKPTSLADMDWQQLSTTEQRAKDGKVQEKLLRLATLNSPSAVAAAAQGDYTCPECQGKACDVMDAGRRDIGKCETWGSSGGDDKGRIVTCLMCSHRWEVSGLV